MKVMLRRNPTGHLMAYVAKKDLEEEIIKSEIIDQETVFTLANGWELGVTGLEAAFSVPQTVEARRIS